MAGPVYTVELNYSGDLIRKMREANREASRLRRTMGAGGVGGRRGSGSGPDPGFRQELQDIQRRFLRRMPFFYNRNYAFAEIGKSFEDIGRAATKAYPALLKLVGPIGALAGVAGAALLAGRYTKKWVGNELFSSEMQTAMRNRANYSLSREMLGDKYDAAMGVATDVAIKSGVSRSSTLDLMNMLSGLKVGGKELSMENASWMAGVVAKLSQYSGREMKQVAINMQQILSTWQGIDIKELFKTAPLISKYINESYQREKSGKFSDIYAFVRSNPQTLIEALDRFAKAFQIPESAQAKGAVELAREHYGLAKEAAYGPLFKGYADAETAYLQGRGKILKEVWDGVSSADVQQAIGHWNSFLLNLVQWGEWVKKMAVQFGGFLGSSDISAAKTAAIVQPRAYSYSSITKAFAESEARKRSVSAQAYADAGLSGFSDVLNPTTMELTMSGIDREEHRKRMLRVLQETKRILPHGGYDDYLMNRTGGAVLPSIVQRYRNGESKLYGWDTDSWGVATGMSGKSFPEALNELIGKYTGKGNNIPDVTTPASGTAAEEEKIQNLTKGSRALIINFNKELVSMVNNIQGNANEILSRIEEEVSQAVSRSMTEALGNTNQIG